MIPPAVKYLDSDAVMSINQGLAIRFEPEYPILFEDICGCKMMLDKGVKLRPRLAQDWFAVS